MIIQALLNSWYQIKLLIYFNQSLLQIWNGLALLLAYGFELQIFIYSHKFYYDLSFLRSVSKRLDYFLFILNYLRL